MRPETWIVRAPPKSEGEPLLSPTTPVIRPKLGELMLMLGSPRLMWLRTLVAVPSALKWTRSVRAKLLLTPVERLTKPGPSTEPTWVLPKRPMGSGTGPEPLPVVQGVPEVQPA